MQRGTSVKKFVRVEKKRNERYTKMAQVSTGTMELLQSSEAMERLELLKKTLCYIFTRLAQFKQATAFTAPSLTRSPADKCADRF